nr:6-phosphofructokinase 1 [Chromochloris zofingiensis]|eukprot:jgi/Chrzof1/15053/Cz09g25120.t1_PFK1[v5.2]
MLLQQHCLAQTLGVHKPARCSAATSFIKRVRGAAPKHLARPCCSAAEATGSETTPQSVVVHVPSQAKKGNEYISGPFGGGRLAEARDDDDVLEVKTLRHELQARDSPFLSDNNAGGGFVGDTDRIRLHVVEFESPESSGAMCANGEHNTFDEDSCLVLPEWAIRAGPRKTIYFDPDKVTAAIVTCGGLCPGLNDVIQNIVTTLADYGVPEDQILGIRYGLRGFYERDDKPVTLTRKSVDGIHLKGGTILGTSRGGASIQEIVRRIDLWGLDMVFVVGGNGGNAAAQAIQEEAEQQGVKCVVAAVPKSIDNDILLIDRCFGFDTAVEEAQRALLAAKVEATSGYKGLGIVKLMGRHSGFIAMSASMASGVVDVCLIPEIPFKMERLLPYIGELLEKRGHVVVCIAEGAGQDSLECGPIETDASGNAILKDVGVYLRDQCKSYFKGEADVKYIDPSYIIRSIPTTSNDRIYCKVLGQGVVHGAFAGYTGFSVGLVNTHYVFLPIPTIIQAPRKVNPRGRRWNRLKTAINQPDLV